MRAIPAFREPAPRIELMDEQGIDRSLMFPTLASLIEERMRDDPDMCHAVDPLAERVDPRDLDVRLRRPHLRHAGHHAAGRRQGDRGARVGRRARRQGGADPSRAGVGLPRAAVVRACPSSTRSGRRSSSTTCWSRCTPRTAATSATPTSGWATTARCCRSSRRPSGCWRQWRPVEDAVAALDLPRRAVAVPRAQGRGDRERQQLGRAAAEQPRRRLQEDAAGLPGGPGRGLQAEHLRQPVLGGGPPARWPS